MKLAAPLVGFALAVAGKGGELYYTEDHSRSFRRIVQ